MSDDDDLAALKAKRDMDRLTLMDRVGEARELASPGVLVARARADVEDRARSVAVQALEIANDNRGVVVATASALLIWAMRQHVGKHLVARFGPTAAVIGKGILEKAVPALMAPVASPLIATLISEKLGPLLGKARRLIPGDKRGD
jgi:hypothetical protein